MIMIKSLFARFVIAFCTIAGFTRIYDRIPQAEPVTFYINEYDVSAPQRLYTEHPQNIVLVNSRRDNFKHRALIRHTWGVRADLLLFYVAAQSLEEDEQIATEFRIHQDLIVMHSPDDYRLLTDKLIAGLGAIDHFNLDFERILRTDDDVYVDLPQLWHDATGDYWGHCLTGAILERRSDSKFYTSYENEPEDKIPTIVSGSTITLTHQAFKRLVTYLTKHHTGVWNDDNAVAYAMHRMHI
ncbi:hypothetical protein SARC_12540, partial [Sphaeroforma arctica JP610]